MLAETGIIEPGAFCGVPDGSITRLGPRPRNPQKPGCLEVWQTLAQAYA